MSATGTTSQAVNSQGALFELVARGNKDAYFFQDDADSLFPFQNTYGPHTPFLAEKRQDHASSAPLFGRTAEFEILLAGDYLRNPCLIIDLPTWLPPTVAKQNSRAVVTDSQGVSYGWTNGIAYFLFERIQFFQDTFMIQEWSGDALWANELTKGTLNSSWLSSTLTGTHDNTALEIGRAATPGQLILHLPIPGCADGGPGFPIRCATEHKYKIRVKLRKLEDLVEASDGRAKPNPWGRSDFRIQTSATSQPTPFSTLLFTDASPLKLVLETTQIYLTDETRAVILKQHLKLPFQQFYESVYTQSGLDYAGVLKGGTSVIQRRIDYARHPSSRLLWFFRSKQDLDANRYTALRNRGGDGGAGAAPGVSGSYYNSVSLQIAGQTRELARAPFVWRDVVAHAKLDLDPGTELGVFDWTRGWTYADALSISRENVKRIQPEGSLNFTTADRPTLSFDLAATSPAETELRVIVLGWAQMEIEGGRAGLLAAN